MKKYLLLAPFMALSLLVSCQSNSSKVATIYGVDDNKIEIIFDAGDGVYNDGLHARSMKFMPGYTWKDIKTVAPSSADIDCGDSIFNGWKYSGGQPIADNDPFKNNTTLIADYNVIKRITVTIDPTSEGHWVGGVSTAKSLVVIEGETWGKYYDSYVVEPTNPENEFKYWTVDNNPIDNSYEFNDGDRIEAVYGVKGVTDDFETDSWPVFIEALNKGLTSIKEKGHSEGGYKEDLVDGSFVGLTRTLRLYNKEYTVQVIGEGVDPITGHSGYNATLTFQFVEAIENALGWNYKDDNTYKNASIRTYLNSQFIDALPDDIIDNIVPVDKYTYAGGGFGQPIIKTSEMIFLPSIKELNIPSFSAGGTSITPENEGLGNDHTSPYAFYAKDTSEGDRLKKQYNNIDCNYWLRSPDAEGIGQAWFVDNNGYIGAKEGSYSVQYGLAIAPCFALGEYYGS